MKKDSEISRMFRYAGNRHWLTVMGMILAGLSTVLSMVPFVCIWFVVRDMINALIKGDISLAEHSSTYAWMAAGFAALSILLYFAALCCLVPLVISVLFMKQMMGGDNAHFMEGYMTALETMNKEAVEYIRGIPVVKVFQQTVYSFKNFHAAIEEYEKYASGYALKCRIPLTGFNVALNGTFILLIPVACMIFSGVSGQAAYQEVILDFLFYSLFTPVCATMMNRVMFASEQLMAAKSAVKRIEEVLNEQPLFETNAPEQPADASITFEHVTFAYPGTEEKALDDVSFEISAGKTVALARAILKDAPVVILDEATAFADAENEHEIQLALEKLTEGKTVLMIAHRLSTIQDADMILVFDGGRIIERGTHESLLAANGRYASMWRDYQTSVNWKVGKEAR